MLFFILFFLFSVVLEWNVTRTGFHEFVVWMSLRSWFRPAFGCFSVFVSAVSRRWQICCFIRFIRAYFKAVCFSLSHEGLYEWRLLLSAVDFAINERLNKERVFHAPASRGPLWSEVFWACFDWALIVSGREFVEARREVFGSFAVGDSIKPLGKKSLRQCKDRSTCATLITAIVKCTVLHCFSIIRIRLVRM